MTVYVCLDDNRNHRLRSKQLHDHKTDEHAKANHESFGGEIKL